MISVGGTKMKMHVTPLSGLGYLCELRFPDGSPVPFPRRSKEEGETPLFIADSVEAINYEVKVASVSGHILEVVFEGGLA